MPRRRFLQAAAAAGGLLVAGPVLWKRPGHAAEVPAARHLTFGADPRRDMHVSWSTTAPVQNAMVDVGLDTGYGLAVAAETRPVAGTATNYHHGHLTGLQPGTTYHYRVRAHEGSVNGTLSSAVSATTFPPPAAPSNLLAERVSATTVRLTWTDNATNETGFRIERSTNGTTWLQIASVGADLTTWSNVNLTSGTTYHYRVRAYEGTSVYSPYTNTVTITA